MKTFLPNTPKLCLLSGFLWYYYYYFFRLYSHLFDDQFYLHKEYDNVLCHRLRLTEVFEELDSHTNEVWIRAKSVQTPKTQPTFWMDGTEHNYVKLNWIGRRRYHLVKLDQSWLWSTCKPNWKLRKSLTTWDGVYLLAVVSRAPPNCVWIYLSYSARGTKRDRKR